MTNEEIVTRESIALMKQGILASIGKVDGIDSDGNKTEIDMPEPIHTYQEWKELGYQVKKGEHAVAKFAVWKPTKQKKTDEDKVEAKPIFFLANASWFKSSQVEKIKDN